MRTSERIAELLNEVGVISVADHPQWSRTMQRMAARGELKRILAGIYSVARANLPLHILCWALMLKDPDAVVTGEAALVLAGIRDRAEVITFHSRREICTPSGFKRLRAEIPVEFVTVIDGVRCALPAWAALQLASTDNGAAIDDILRLRHASYQELRGQLPHFRHRLGNTIRRMVVADSRDEPWSQAERRTHTILRRAGIKGWSTNHPVRCPSGMRFLDIAIERLKLAIEIDGYSVHSARRVFEDDRLRNNELVAAGWTVLHFTWEMLNDVAAVAERVNDVIHQLEGRRKRGRRRLTSPPLQNLS